MAYVTPSGEIIIYRGVPLSPNYNDVLYSTSDNDKRAQLGLGYQYKRYSAESYTRQETGALRIRENPDSIVEFNYLSFTNKFNGGTKTFFCFITSVNYINNNCAEITFIIDDFMTWFHVLELGQCFVEREIPETDNLYENLVPENIETGEYINNKLDEYDLGADPYYLIEATTDTMGNPIVGSVSGFACPVNFLKIPVSAEPSVLQALLKNWTDPTELGSRATPDDIITIQIVPKKLAEAAVPEPNSDKGHMFSDLQDIQILDTLDGYSPKNKKLLTYPYRQLIVSNNGGTAKTFKIELLGGGGEDYITFEIAGSCLGQPTIACYPTNYKGVWRATDEALFLTNFPPVPWNCDTYKAYLAQNKASIATSILTGAVSLLPTAFNSASLSSTAGAFGARSVNVTTQNYSGRLSMTEMAGVSRNNVQGMSVNSTGILGGVGQIAQTIAKIYDAQFMPVTIANVAQGDMLTILLDKYKFSFYQVSIKYEMAKIIDDYFSAYGYAQHKIKRPNINSRPNWNYTKTNGCVLLGAAPAQAKANIINAMDNGVRFWKKLQNIGNFSLPNNP